MMTPGPGEQGYWDQELAPDMVWNPGEKRLKVQVNKKTHKVRFERESEDEVTIVVEPKDAPNTGPLKP